MIYRGGQTSENKNCILWKISHSPFRQEKSSKCLEDQSFSPQGRTMSYCQSKATHSYQQRHTTPAVCVAVQKNDLGKKPRLELFISTVDFNATASGQKLARKSQTCHREGKETRDKRNHGLSGTCRSSEPGNLNSAAQCQITVPLYVRAGQKPGSCETGLF